MKHSVVACFLLAVAVCSDAYSDVSSLRPTRRHINLSATRRVTTDCITCKRWKRSAQIIGAAFLAGMRAVKTFLKGAEQKRSMRPDIVYVKSGGYKQALKDFETVRPTDVWESIYYLSGTVGDRKIRVLKQGLKGMPTVEITAQSYVDKAVISKTIIIYKN